MLHADRRLLRGVRPVPAAQARQAARAPHAGRAPRARAGPRAATSSAASASTSGASTARASASPTPSTRSSAARRSSSAARSSAIERREDTGEVVAVRYRDRATGESGAAHAPRAVVNATGAWAPITASLGGLAPDARARAARQGHPRRLRSAPHELRDHREDDRRAADLRRALAEHERHRHDRRRLLRRPRRRPRRRARRCATSSQGIARVFPQIRDGARDRHVRRRAADALRVRPDRGRALARSRDRRSRARTARPASTR